MKTKLQLWGNSLALRIPKPFATEMRLKRNSPVELLLEKGRLVILPLTDPTPTLDDLLRDVTSENIHGEIDMGASLGNEAW